MKIFYFIFIVSISLLEAVTFRGVGYDQDEKQAKKEALVDLSQNLSVQVESSFKQKIKGVNNTFTKDIEETIQLRSHLPLKGIHFKYYNNYVEVVISTEDSLPIYLEELQRLREEINREVPKIDKIDDEALKFELLTELLRKIQEYKTHKLVAFLLGSKEIVNLSVDEIKIKKELQSLQKKVSSLDTLAQILAQQFSQKKIYIVPLKTQSSAEVTQFAKILKAKLKQRLDSVEKIQDAHYILRGQYEILKNKDMFLSFILLDKYNTRYKNITITLSHKGYKNYVYLPKTKSIDDEVNSGNVTDGSLRIKILFKNFPSSDGIDLYESDIIDIYGKSNKDICYFLQGITVTQDGKSYAYLIERDNGTIISYITGNDINKAIPLLSDVEIAEPFGVEKVMMFAQTLKNGKCVLHPPSCKTDPQTELCIIAKNPIESITKSRALFSKHHKKNKTARMQESAEAVLNFTTFKK